jgi:hypothetical protein
MFHLEEASDASTAPDLYGDRLLTRRRLLGSAVLGLAAVLVDGDRAVAALARVDRGLTSSASPFRSRPDLNPPRIAITIPDTDPPAGHLLVAPFHAAGTTPVSQYGPLIVDVAGNPLWFQPLPIDTSATAFRMQQYEGKPVLTWWQGQIVSGYGQGEYVIVDSSYRELKRVMAGNGYQGDLHEFLLTPQGTALITAYDTITADLGPVGGASPGLLLDSIVQEVDVASGAVVFEWHSLDHVDLQESYAFLPAPDQPYDFFHVNSVDVDSDGNLLVSSRHTCTVYKLDRQTGEIIWRLGGKSSDFELGSGAAFNWQHDARRQPDGTITLFDNSANGVHSQQFSQQSRGLTLALDMDSMTASLVREYLHPTGLLSSAMGNMQTLSGGEAFIGWGIQPYFSGFDAQVELTLDADLPMGGQSYRAFRFPWVAHPHDSPTFAIDANAGGKTTIYVSWNGATEVVQWRVLAGPHPTALRPVRTVPRHGFETAITVPVRTGFVAVEALDRSNRVLAGSPPRLLAA